MTDNDGLHDYTYDSLYQIIGATHPTVNNPLEQFSYDAVGNRLTDLTHANYQYNELNQLTEDDSCTYTYDADGNMTAKINKQTEDTTVYTYDIENKLVQVQKAGMLARYTYDALGRRMSKEVNGEVKHYRYDGEDLILEMNGNDSITANYTFGPGIDDPLEMNRAGNEYYYVKDALGSVTSLTDNSGNVVHEYNYSVFGKIVSESGDSVENPFTYTSRELDKETGNYYYRARYYDPKNGRFLNEDPIGFRGSDENFYRYCINNPLNYFDPTGLAKKKGGEGSSSPYIGSGTIPSPDPTKGNPVFFSENAGKWIYDTSPESDPSNSQYARKGVLFPYGNPHGFKTDIPCSDASRVASVGKGIAGVGSVIGGAVLIVLFVFVSPAY
jgi:RHS repeat-associated protein